MPSPIKWLRMIDMNDTNDTVDTNDTNDTSINSINSKQSSLIRVTGADRPFLPEVDGIYPCDPYHSYQRYHQWLEV